MEHLRLDNQTAPIAAEGIGQEIYRYVYIRGRCSLVELFPIYARKEGFLAALEQLLAGKFLDTDLKAIWAREKQVVFTETPLSRPEESDDRVLSILNQQKHKVGEHFTFQGSLHINRDFQLQWHRMTLRPGDPFYLDHFYDFRGRIYPKGHILTYQGTDFQKSLIRSMPYEVEE